MNLLEAVRSLDPMEIEHLSGIRIAPRAGEIVATFSISLRLPVGAAPELPAGVSMRGFERWPDQERALDWRTPIEAQIRELAESGIIGGLDTAKHGDREEHWIIKSHAGSQAERLKWNSQRA